MTLIVDTEVSIASYIAHLRKVTSAFNRFAKAEKLPVRADASKLIKLVEGGLISRDAATFESRIDDTGIVHESQLETAIKCLVRLKDDSKRCGHVVGAMQSGKTTTSLALQWAGPVLYALTGQKVYPYYLIGSQTNHEDQTKTELARFLSYYGDIEVKPASAATGVELNPLFMRIPSLRNYREHVLTGMEEGDTFSVPRMDEIVCRRVGGESSVKRIADLCRRAVGQGFKPLMIIDEPQFGASDRIVKDESGTVRRKCVLVQMFDRIESELATTREDHWFVGLSATPFELNDLERVWEVRQSLTDQYSGFNFFNSREIDEGVTVRPPQVFGVSRYAELIKVPFLAKLNMAAFDGSPATFSRHARRVGFDDTQIAFQLRSVEALRAMIYDATDRYAQQGKSVGLCIRAFNDNGKTEALVARLGLDPQRIEVIGYFGASAIGLSVKRMIAKRQKPHLPYVMFVTNRARMADAFPVEVRFFMDLAEKASDLNSLLQGLLGRACGYGKQSTVVLSDSNAGIVESYAATNGSYVHKTSRHSIAINFRRGAPSGMLKLRSDLNDPKVERFFKRLNKEVVEKNAAPGVKFKTPRASGGRKFRTGPILTIAESLKLFDHLEDPSVRPLLFPEIPTGFKVARPNDRIRHSRKPDLYLQYALDQDGNCRYTFRWSDRESAAQGGAAGRAKGLKDTGQHVEPTIYVEKYDPKTGETIPKESKRAGAWRAFMVTFPLLEPVRETRAAEVALPIEESPYSAWMSDEERTRRDQATTSKKSRKSR